VTAVDEDEAERRRPVRGDPRRGADDPDDEVVGIARLDPLPPSGKGVHLAGRLVDEAPLVVGPARLHLLGAVVVVDAVEHGRSARRGDACGEEEGRSAEIAADLEEWTEPGPGRVRCRRAKRLAFVDGEKAGGLARGVAERVRTPGRFAAHGAGDQPAR